MLRNKKNLVGTLRKKRQIPHSFVNKQKRNKKQVCLGANHRNLLTILSKKMHLKLVDDHLKKRAAIVTSHKQLRQKVTAATGRFSQFKSRLIYLYSKYKSSFFYKRSYQDLGLSHEKRVVLENLNKVKIIIICKPDKGNGVVVMNRNDYTGKMNKNLQDLKQFKKVANDNNIENLSDQIIDIKITCRLITIS